MRFSIQAGLLWALFLSVCGAATSQELSSARAKSKKPYVVLKNGNFERLLTGPRNFTVAVLLTATSSQIGCTLCSIFEPDFTAVASSWVQKHPKDDGLYFAKADFAENTRKVFEAFKLSSVPKLYLFKPTDEALPLTEGFEEYRFFEGDQASFFLGFLEEHTGQRIEVVKPIRYDNIILSVVLFLGLGMLFWKFQSALSKVLLSRQLWGGLMIILVLLFISGYMFNQIRGVPYMGQLNGRPEYFAAGQQNQFAVETNILSTLYGMLVVLTVALATKAPKIQNPKLQAILVAALMFSVWFCYSLLTDIFAKKSYGYPYKLWLLF